MPGQLIADAVQFAQANPFAGAVGAAVITGAAHWITHKLAGDEWAFEEAGVKKAGFAVMVVTAAIAFLVLNGGLA